MSTTIDASVNIASPAGTEKIPVGNGTGLPKHILFSQFTSAAVAQTITNGVTTTAPSQDVVFDALAAKQDASGTAAAAVAAVVVQTITNGDTTHAPSGDVVFDTLATKQPLDTQLTDVAALSYTANALKVVRVNAGATAFELATLTAGATSIDELTDGWAPGGDGNILLGSPSGGASITSASGATALGSAALQSVTSGTANTAIGTNALTNLTTGINNTSVGNGSGTQIITGGSNNVLIGWKAGDTIATGTSNVVIGSDADVTSSSAVNRIAIGALVSSTDDNSWMIGKLGTKQYIKEGADGVMGLATLTAGTVTVSTTRVTANSRIFLTAQNLGTITVPVGLAVSARNAGTDFTILSGNLADTSSIAWEIKEPA